MAEQQVILRMERMEFHTELRRVPPASTQRFGWRDASPRHTEGEQKSEQLSTEHTLKIPAGLSFKVKAVSAASILHYVMGFNYTIT